LKETWEHKKNKFVKEKRESAEMRKKIEENPGWCREAGKSRERKREGERKKRLRYLYQEVEKEMLLEELKHQ